MDASEQTTPRTALVATVRGAGELINAFVQYHLHVGFNHVYLFFDDPQDPTLDVMQRHPQVTITLHDEHLRQRWRQTRFYRLQGYDKKVTNYLMDRQLLNVAVAVQMALDDGKTWLLHIDQDELLYAPEFFQSSRQTVGDMFRSLEEKGFANVNFRNHEAVTEQIDIRDPFTEVTLFKRNPNTLQNGQLSSEQKSLIQSIPKLPKHFFFNYRNGKSAAQVLADLVPDGVHDFFLTEQQGFLPHWRRRLVRNRLIRWIAKYWPSINPLRRRLLRKQQERLMYSKNPVILHYLNCGFEQFWTKYRTFDYYSEFENPRILDVLSQFHAAAHKIAHRGDEVAARDFYRQRLVIDDQEMIEQLTDSGLLCRITEPATWLKSQGF